MNLKSIGENIRKYRLKKNLRQEDLAEGVNLTANYVGMIERGEKVPALDTFIKIANFLEISSDILLVEVISNKYTLKTSLLSEKIDQLLPSDKDKIYDVIDTMIKHSSPSK